VIEDTVLQAHRLISQLEDKKRDISMETPLLPTSRKIRPDLWQKAADWKKHPGFACGEDLVAQLEVQLVWAGHEDKQLGWRHAKPYLQAAERLAKEAGRKIENCPAQDASSEKVNVISMTVEGDMIQGVCAPEPAICPSCPACPPQLAVAAERVVRTETTPQVIAPVSTANGSAAEIVPDRVHFALNRDIISARSAAALQRIAAVLRTHPEVNVELQGHADERGNETFNKVLSRQRAEVVRTYLVSAGIQRTRISIRAFGMTTPVMRGSDILSYARNRRVEFVFKGDGIKAAPQYEDLQVEKVRQ
jgi:outer membrane protein OmpA-like peptidoglycan-associated protein